MRSRGRRLIRHINISSNFISERDPARVYGEERDAGHDDPERYALQEWTEAHLLQRALGEAGANQE